MPEIDAIADVTGIPVAVLTGIYSDACLVAASHGLAQHEAEREAIASLKREASRLSHFGARFP
jgi:hypothetical protein